MVPGYDFFKAKIGRGESYPLKRSHLDAALVGGEVSAIHAVHYGRRLRGDDVVSAIYSGEGLKRWAWAGRSSLSIYAVPSGERAAVEEAILSRVLPAMVRWLKALEDAGNTRRGVSQEFHASWRDGQTTITSS